MESLVNYESDDGDTKSQKKTHSREHPTVRSDGHEADSRKRKASESSDSDGDNYEHVKMDLSEGSDASGKSVSPKPQASSKTINCDDDRDSRPENSDKRHSRDDTKTETKHRNDDRDSRYDDRRRNKNYDSKDRDRRSRSRDKEYKDRYNIDRRDRYDDRDKYERRDRDRRDDHDRAKKYDRREQGRNNYDRNRDRNRKDDRDKRSSPRYRDDKRQGGPSNYRNDRKEYGKRYNDTSPSKSSHYEKSASSPSHRSQNQDEPDGSRQNNTANMNRPSNYRSRSIERRAHEKVQQLQRLGIEIPALTATMLPMPLPQLIKQPLLPTPAAPPSIACTTTATMMPATTEKPNTEPESTTETNLSINLSNFTSPVLVNPRYTEQMQKKKLIWGSKKTDANNASSVTVLPVTNNKWEDAKFSQDNDGKVASKFLRLMGVKNADAVTKSHETTVSESESDPSVKKRQEMFSSMEQQYEMARQATHTMRGVGLGFGSQARQF